MYCVYLFLFIIFYSSEAQISPRTDPSLGDEWIGPLPEWKWVTNDFGAKGDGISDDTAAIQAALNFAAYNEFIYFPPGTYIITQSLTMTSNKQSSIVGHDPTNTIIKYDGPDCHDNTFECVMLHTNGVASMKFARLTWDGNYKMHTCIQNYWDGCVDGYSGDSVHEDEIFTNAWFGVRAGSNHGGCGPNGATAEWSIVRSQFINLAQAGFSVEDWNALDWFIRQCIFVNIPYGATDIFGEGGFHVYESQFFGSTVADLVYGNCGYFSIRDNYSYNSKRFLFAPDSACALQLAVQRNTVIAPFSDDNTPMIYLGGPHYVTLLDNVFVMNSLSQGPAFIWNSWWVANGSLISINNTFGANGGISNALKFGGLMTTMERIRMIQDRVILPEKVFWTQSTIPAFQPISTRMIFTLPPPSGGMDNDLIQSVISQASLYVGQRPIVYLACGKYMVDRSIVFPPNSDIQLVGRERASWWQANEALISWQGATAGQPILLLEGPSQVTVKFVTLLGNFIADGIWITNADQVGARVYVENFYPLNPTLHNVVANKLDLAHLDFYHFFVGGIKNSPGVIATGGACSSAGHATAFRLASFGGATSADTDTGSLYLVQRGAKMSITDAWYEGSGIGWLNMSHTAGSFSLSGGVVSPYSHPSTKPTITLDNFQGNVLINDASIVGSVAVSNIPMKSNILFGEVMFLNSSFFASNVNGSSNFLTSTHNPDGNPNSEKLYIEDTLSVTRSKDVTGILNAFSVLRNAQRKPPGPADNRPSGITDVRLFRNWEIYASTVLRIDGNLKGDHPRC